MQEKYSWKRTDEIEIDLADLLKRLCGQWKQIAACAMAAAVILGSYGWLKGRSVADADVPAAAAEEILLTEAQEQAVADAIQLNKEIQGLETYLENSVLMQIDPYHKARHTMLYCVDFADRKELPAITESYLNFVHNGGVADMLAETGSGWKMDNSYLNELLSAYQRTYSSPYQIVADNTADNSLSAESLFYVEVTGKNKREAEKLALDIQEILKDYYAKVKKTAGNHRFRLVSSVESITADSSLQSQQHEKRNLLSSSRSNLKNITDAFHDEQMAVYMKSAGEESDDSQEESAKTSVKAYKICLKYIILGLFLGLLLAGGIYSCWYLLSDRIKSTEEMKRMYVFPVFGEIRRAGMMPDSCDYGQGQVWNRIRLVCQKQGITAVSAAAGFALLKQEKECLEDMSEKLKEWGIRLCVSENAMEDTSVWDNLAETGTVLLLCRIGTATHQMIDDMMQFYMENGIAVIGAAAFLSE